MPAPPLFAIVLSPPGDVEPTKNVPPRTPCTPSPPFGSGVSPLAATPIRLPVIVVWSVPPSTMIPSALVRYVPGCSAFPEMTLPVIVSLVAISCEA